MLVTMMQPDSQEESYGFQALFAANKQLMAPKQYQNEQQGFPSAMYMEKLLDDSSLQFVVQKHTSCMQVPRIPAETACSHGSKILGKKDSLDMRTGPKCAQLAYHPFATKPVEDFRTPKNDTGMPLVSPPYISTERKYISGEPEVSHGWNGYCKTSSSFSHSPEITQKTDVGSSITFKQKTSDRRNCVDPCSSVAISPASDRESDLVESTDLSSAHGGLKSIKSSHVQGKTKRKAKGCFDSESEDTYDDTVIPKKVQRVRSATLKRTRAPESHNRSERKRRGKINEKLRALQALIPTSSKTDKASLLTEIIKYLKKLRLQLQVLSSYPNTATISWISDNMHYGEAPHTENTLESARQGMKENTMLPSFQTSTTPTGFGPSSAQIHSSSSPHFVNASIETPFGNSNPQHSNLSVVPHMLAPTNLEDTIRFHHL